MKSVSIVIKILDGGDFNVRLGEFLACAETLFLHRSVEQIFKARANHRARAAGGRRSEKNIFDVIRLPFDFDQHFLLQLVRSNKCHGSIVAIVRSGSPARSQRCRQRAKTTSRTPRSRLRPTKPAPCCRVSSRRRGRSKRIFWSYCRGGL